MTARRLVEPGVRMVQVVYGSGQPWDDHGGVEKGHRTKAKDTDKAAALFRNPKDRGLLDETLVLWGGEFGLTDVAGVVVKDILKWTAGGRPTVSGRIDCSPCH